MVPLVDKSLLVPSGDVPAIVRRAADILSADVELYAGLAARCREVAQQFCWDRIAADTLAAYRERMATLAG